MTHYELEADDLVRVTFDRRAVDTDDAYGVEVGEFDDLLWLPKSCVEVIEERQAWLPRWLAEKEGLEYE